MNQYLIVLRPTRPEMLREGPNDAETAAVGAHFAYLQQLLAEGRLILAGRTLNNDESTLGLCIFEAPDEAAARAVMENDPAVARGVMHGQLFPYRVAVSR